MQIVAVLRFEGNATEQHTLQAKKQLLDALAAGRSVAVIIFLMLGNHRCVHCRTVACTLEKPAPHDYELPQVCSVQLFYVLVRLMHIQHGTSACHMLRGVHQNMYCF